MKTWVRFLFAIGLSGVVAGPMQAAERLYDTFNAYPTGSIALQPGWGRYPVLLTQTAQVSAALAHVSSNALELVWHTNGCSAAYTNFRAVYRGTGMHPVIRVSADLYLANTNTPFQIGLRNSQSGAFLAFEGEGGYGTFGFNYRDIVFVPLKQSQLVNVTLYYNMSNREYALNYNHSNVLNWIDSQYEANNAVIHTQFDQFVITRLSNTTATTGAMFVDNVQVETFPEHAWVWMRFDYLGNAVVDQLGTLKPSLRQGYSDAFRIPASDPVWDGEADFHNRGALRQLIAGPHACSRVMPVTTNWTMEAVFRTRPGDGIFQLMDWAYGPGGSSTGSWIGLTYRPDGDGFVFSLRDGDNGTNMTYQGTFIGNLPPDDRWHHVALVKDRTNLTLFVDYQTNGTFGLGGYAGGPYVFDHRSAATFGRTLNNANYMGPNTVIDEVRFSGRALAEREFLQPGQPLIVGTIDPPSDPPWRMIMKGILGTTCRVDVAGSLLDPAAWSPVATVSVNNTFTFFSLPTNLPPAPVVRIMRQR